MERFARVMLLLFAVAFVGAAAYTAVLVSSGRSALIGTAGGGAAAPRMRYHLVLITPDSEDSFYGGFVRGAVERAALVGAAVQVLRYAPSSGAEVERAYDIAIRSRADGIIMVVPRGDSVALRAEGARRRGIAFVPVGADPQTSGPGDARGGFTLASSGLLQGLEAGKLVGARLGAAARIGVVLPPGEERESAEEPLARGLRAALGAYPGARIQATLRARPGALSGEESASSLLRAHPEINALVCSSALDTVGAAQVVVDLNLVGKVLIVGADENEEIRRYLAKGVIAASVVRDSRRLGAEAVRAFESIKAGLGEIAPIEVGFSLKLAAEAAP